MAKKATKTTTKRATTRSDQTPEAKRTAKDQSAAAQKMFDNAEDAARSGLPHDLTVEQHETHVRRAALGY
jgi:hypothetical protein